MDGKRTSAAFEICASAGEMGHAAQHRIRSVINTVSPKQFLYVGVLVPIPAPPAQPFQRIDGCFYKPQRWNDGDSFHVILPDQKELIFRLYFVDAPEEERAYADRISEQAAYFGISSDAATEI